MCFYLCDPWIGDHSAAISNLAIPMVLEPILEGVPESVGIGLGILEHRTVNLAILGAIVPSILPLWLVIAVVCSIASGLGYRLCSAPPMDWLSWIQTFAGVAILVMLSNSIIPESFIQAGKLAGLFALQGFFVSVAIVVAQAMGAIG